MARIVIVGAGIAGLGAAYALQKAGCEVLVLEREAQAGGRMITRSEAGFTWDAGAQFMVEAEYVHLRSLMAELGLPMAAHRIPSTQMIALPGRPWYTTLNSPMALLAHPRLGVREKWRVARVIGRMMLQAARNPEAMDFHRLDRVAALDTESLREWGDRALGAEAVDYLLSLPTSTLFFWKPEETPWWVVPGMAWQGRRWKVTVPQGGMGAVPEALAGRLQVRLGVHVRQIDVREDGTFCLRVEGPEGRADVSADRVVLAVPAPAALAALPDPVAALGRAWADCLRETRYVPNLTTAIGYHQAPERRAYGVSFPFVTDPAIAGISWEHLKGPDRAPAGAGLGVFMPTGPQSERLWEHTDEAAGAALAAAAEPLYPRSTGRIALSRVSRWRHAIPIFPPGRAAQLARLGEARPDRGVHLCGDYLLGACTELAYTSGLRTAEEVLRSL